MQANVVTGMPIPITKIQTSHKCHISTRFMKGFKLCLFLVIAHMDLCLVIYFALIELLAISIKQYTIFLQKKTSNAAGLALD